MVRPFSLTISGESLPIFFVREDKIDRENDFTADTDTSNVGFA